MKILKISEACSLPENSCNKAPNIFFFKGCFRKEECLTLFLPDTIHSKLRPFFHPRGSRSYFPFMYTHTTGPPSGRSLEEYGIWVTKWLQRGIHHPLSYYTATQILLFYKLIHYWDFITCKFM